MPWLGETPEHDTYHCELGEAFRDEGKRFVGPSDVDCVGARTTSVRSPIAYARPGSRHVIRALYDFQLDRLPLERCFELLYSIGEIGDPHSSAIAGADTGRVIRNVGAGRLGELLTGLLFGAGV